MQLGIDVDLHIAKHRIHVYYGWPCRLWVAVDACRVRGARHQWRRRWIIEPWRTERY